MRVSNPKGLSKQVQAPLPLLQQCDDWLQAEIELQDLNELIGIRAKRHSYCYAPEDAGDGRVFTGDLLLIDSQLKASQNDLVLVVLDDQFALGYLDISNQRISVCDGSVIEMDEQRHCNVYGVVVASVRQF